MYGNRQPITFIKCVFHCHEQLSESPHMHPKRKYMFCELPSRAPAFAIQFFVLPLPTDPSTAVVTVLFHGWDRFTRRCIQVRTVLFTLFVDRTLQTTRCISWPRSAGQKRKYLRQMKAEPTLIKELTLAQRKGAHIVAAAGAHDSDRRT